MQFHLFLRHNTSAALSPAIGKFEQKLHRLRNCRTPLCSERTALWLREMLTNKDTKTKNTDKSCTLSCSYNLSRYCTYNVYHKLAGGGIYFVGHLCYSFLGVLLCWTVIKDLSYKQTTKININTNESKNVNTKMNTNTNTNTCIMYILAQLHCSGVQIRSRG